MRYAIVGIIVVGVIMFALNWVFTLGIIWVLKDLFGIDWSSKFWAVFLCQFLIWIFLKGIFSKK